MILKGKYFLLIISLPFWKKIKVLAFENKSQKTREF